LLDVSTGGNHPLQHPHVKPAYQAPFAIAVKKVVGNKMKVGTVGGIENATLANDLLEKDGLDIVTVGRGFQKNPGLGEWICCKIKWICDADGFSLRVGRRVGPQSTYAKPDRVGVRREESKGKYKVFESAH
jgi:hypothetical protein